ncbi:MAG: SEL1-like repeat protein [Bacteroidales bacterium]|nr:SEL1-like repeat protein [Bacteroidales bacterium]
MKYDVFISYRREGGYETAKHLNDLLVRDGYRVSFDIDTLRSGDFDTQLLTRIEQCKDFILIVDEHAFDRTIDPETNPNEDWLRCELAHALKHNKNIIPVFLSGVAGFPDGLPDDVVGVVTKNGPEYNKFHFDNFYKVLCKRFIKSISRKTKVLFSGISMLLLISLLCVVKLMNYDYVIWDNPTAPKSIDKIEFENFVKNEMSLIEDFDNEDSVIILKKWMQESEQGCSNAQYNLGLCYFSGRWVEKNYKTALEYLKKSSMQFNEKAQYCIGCFYNNGIYVKEDCEEAAEWNLLSAQMGYAPAQDEYGLYCMSVENYDPKEAVVWFTESAEQGYAPAQYHLAVCYSNNVGVDRDMEKSMYWLKKSADQGYIIAQYALASIYANIDGYIDVEECIRILEILVNKNYAPAQYDLACCYSGNIGHVGIDYDKAFELLTNSVKQNYAPAITDLANLYMYSNREFGISKDYDKAMKLLLQAVDLGYPYAYYCVGQMYQYGFGVNQNMRKAQKWYNKAKERGFDNQQFYDSQQQAAKLKNL